MKLILFIALMLFLVSSYPAVGDDEESLDNYHGYGGHRSRRSQDNARGSWFHEDLSWSRKNVLRNSPLPADEEDMARVSYRRTYRYKNVGPVQEETGTWKDEYDPTSGRAGYTKPQIDDGKTPRGALINPVTGEKYELEDTGYVGSNGAHYSVVPNGIVNSKTGQAIPSGAINPRNGEFYPSIDNGGAVINHQGQVFPSTGSGNYIDPRTGEPLPGVR